MVIGSSGIWLWLKYMYQTWHLGKWNQRLKPAVCARAPYPCPSTRSRAIEELKAAKAVRDGAEAAEKVGKGKKAEAPRSGCLGHGSIHYMAVGQNQWYHFGVGAPPSLVYFCGDWDVHWGYGFLTHDHIAAHLHKIPGVTYIQKYVCARVIIYIYYICIHMHIYIYRQYTYIHPSCSHTYIAYT